MPYGSISVDKIENSDGFTLGGSGAAIKNRIINGAMVIDQRNAGASVTQGTSDTYSLDRFLGYGNITSKFTMQQSSTAPAGFVNSVVITSSAATVVGSSDQYYFAQKIEGYNTADLGWGTANAKTVTLSFWARASVIGTYSVFLLNNGSAYSYVANYTISVADTFEYKTITIVAPTVGTWLTTNGLGIYLGWDLGSGSTLNQTAGSWQAANKRATSGSTQLVATSGATLYLTGVQLEVGSTATSFDYRSIGTETSLCQRYYYKFKSTGSGVDYALGYALSSTGFRDITAFPVTMRTVPSSLEQTGTASDYSIRAPAGTVTCSAVPFYYGGTANVALTEYTVSSGLTTGQGSSSRFPNTNGYVAWSAEL
jgi:hypothetical protein